MLVCGSRTWRDAALLDQLLTAVADRQPDAIDAAAADLADLLLTDPAAGPASANLDTVLTARAAIDAVSGPGHPASGADVLGLVAAALLGDADQVVHAATFLSAYLATLARRNDHPGHSDRLGGRP